MGEIAERTWVELKYDGADAEHSEISLYDLSQALYGFERSLALTTHLVLNNEVITQATALRGAQIIARPPKEGSFSILAAIGLFAVGGYKVATLKKDNPLGHLVFSAYDYVVHKVTGQALDYEKSIRQLYEDGRLEERANLKIPRDTQFDSLAEKIEPPLTRMHRPIIRSETAESAKIIFPTGLLGERRVIDFDRTSYSRIKYRSRAEEIQVVKGIISVFNPNTFNGRIYNSKLERTIPFFLTHAGRSARAFELIADSYSRNLIQRGAENAMLEVDVIETTSKLGRTTKYSVIGVRKLSLDDVSLMDD